MNLMNLMSIDYKLVQQDLDERVRQAQQANLVRRLRANQPKTPNRLLASLGDWLITCGMSLKTPQQRYV